MARRLSSRSQLACANVNMGGFAFCSRAIGLHQAKVRQASAQQFLSLDFECQSPDEGPAGKRPPESANQETDEATFAKQLAKELYRRAHSGDFKALVLIADPQTLGQIRPTLHKEVQERLVSEIGKALTKASITDIQRALN